MTQAAPMSIEEMFVDAPVREAYMRWCATTSTEPGDWGAAPWRSTVATFGRQAVRYQRPHSQLVATGMLRFDAGAVAFALELAGLLASWPELDNDPARHTRAADIALAVVRSETAADTCSLADRGWTPATLERALRGSVVAYTVRPESDIVRVLLTELTGVDFHEAVAATHPLMRALFNQALTDTHQALMTIYGALGAERTLKHVTPYVGGYLVYEWLPLHAPTAEDPPAS